MPELNVVHIGIIAVMTVVGAVIGWVVRGKRSSEEKAAVSALWQEQIDAQRSEHERLTEQNKGLMEQISQYQASNMDAKNRARELSEAVREAYSRRDELQREIKDIRGNLEVAMSQRDQLQSSISASDDTSAALEAKQQRISKLQNELANWQNRLPPLIEKYRQRNEDAERLEAELAAAREQIADLLERQSLQQTRIEPVSDPDALTDGRDASNDASEEHQHELQDDGLGEQSDDVSDTGEEPAHFDATRFDDENEDDRDDDIRDDAMPVEAPPLNGARDSLQAIKGVGPAIEKTLNEMGIFNYQQIAEMSEYDIDRVAKRLKGFRSRIYREDWIGQARELRDQTASN